MAVVPWQDREIRFDAPERQLQPRSGEAIVSELEGVEDTKGNNGDKGILYITNLRLIWISEVQSRISLSIGLKTITSVRTKRAQSRLRGLAEALYLMTKQNKTQFEFIFTSLAADSCRMFSIVMAIARAYETTSAYREIVLRSAVLSNRDLKLLPQEQLYTKLGGVWNLSSDRGNLGVMYVTNIRVVWQCQLNDNFNISIPFLQMKAIKVRDTKFGVAMVVEAGTMVLGFKIDSYDTLKKTLKEIQSLHQVFRSSPIFGVEYEEEKRVESATPTNTTDSIPEDVEVVNTASDTLAAYLADPHKTQDREAVFSHELGLAIEKLPEGYSLKDLWEISCISAS